MSDEKWLREGLADAVPEPPINPDRAHAAERLARRRRRTTALAVVGTAGAVAAAAVLTATLASGGDDPDDATDTASEAPAFVVECPEITVHKDGTAEGSEIDEPDPGAPDAVPEGATSARLCQGPGTTVEVPEEALVSGVDALVAAVNDLEASPEHEMCRLDLGPGYRIAFGYDDGSTFVISGKLYGCRTLVVGSTYRAGPEAVQAAFLELLDQQQEAYGDAANLSCSASASSTDFTGITTAILCVDDGSGIQVSAVVDPDDLDFLTDDMAAHQSNSVLRCALPPPYPTIVGAEGDGPAVVIPSECGTGFWRLPNGKAWMPSEKAVAILDRLVNEAR